MVKKFRNFRQKDYNKDNFYTAKEISKENINDFAPPNKLKMCKYFLVGRCKIKNCTYLHSDLPEDTHCKYFQIGACLRGKDCHFRHEYCRETSNLQNLNLDQINENEQNPNEANNGNEIFKTGPDLFSKHEYPAGFAQWSGKGTENAKAFSAANKNESQKKFKNQIKGSSFKKYRKRIIKTCLRSKAAEFGSREAELYTPEFFNKMLTDNLHSQPKCKRSVSEETLRTDKMCHPSKNKSRSIEKELCFEKNKKNDKNGKELKNSKKDGEKDIGNEFIESLERMRISEMEQKAYCEDPGSINWDTWPYNPGQVGKVFGGRHWQTFHAPLSIETKLNMEKNHYNQNRFNGGKQLGKQTVFMNIGDGNQETKQRPFAVMPWEQTELEKSSSKNNAIINEGNGRSLGFIKTDKECGVRIENEKNAPFLKKESINEKTSMITQKKKPFLKRMSMANVVELKILQNEMFPGVDRKEVRREFEENERDGTRTRINLEKVYGKYEKKKSQRPQNKTYDNFNKKDIKNKVWVETGDSLNNLYRSLREKAIICAQKRNKCFSKASDAYLSGDYDLSKFYSEVGRKHDKRMKELHKKASREIFRIRNEALLERRKGSKEGSFDMKFADTIDLHGLHEKEAIDFLKTHIENKSGGKTLDVVCGNGHHTEKLKPKLLKSICRFLQEEGLWFESISADEHGGLLRIFFER